MCCPQKFIPADYQATIGTSLIVQLVQHHRDKDTYTYVKVAWKHKNFVHFDFQGVAYKYNRLLFGYSLAPCTFSRRVDVALDVANGSSSHIVASGAVTYAQPAFACTPGDRRDAY